jgi:predicted lactoylglutathione lyase
LTTETGIDKIFLNIHIKNLKISMDFFQKMGFTFNMQFTSDEATCMIISEHIYVMLVEEPLFQTFSDKAIPDLTKSAQTITALSVQSREQVNELVNKAFAAGGHKAKDPVDHGFMYSWSFQDLDYHLWEVFYMDPSHVQ